MTEPFRWPHEYAHLPEAIRSEELRIPAADGFPLGARLYLPPSGEADTALCVMHPRGDFRRHYLAPLAAGAGYALLAANSRYLNNDADALHERLCLDVAGAVAFLRSRFARVVLVGNSGGGPLFALYLQQAALAPEERLARAPSGDRVPLGRFELPPADAFVLLAAHLGEGRFLLERLDPSVVDEADPTAADPRLDMYDPANGYRPLEQGPSRYAPDFVAAFRAAQRERCARLDRRALEWCEEAAWWKARLGALEEEGADASERTRAARRGLQRRYQVVYRTLADPRYLDPMLDPSPRPPGSIFSFGQDPIKGNYGEGLARVMSARGWLSTWSGLASRASLPDTLPDVTLPTLVLHVAADQEIHPGEARRAFEACGARDRVFAELTGADHYLRPLPGTDPTDPVARLWDATLHPWLRERFPV